MNAPAELLGIVPGLDIDAYHSGPGISKSGLDLIARSPYRYWAWKLNPARPPEPERAGQLEGTLAHCAILEPGEFSKRYAVGHDASRATKAWKEWEAALPDGVIGIKPDQYDTAMRQAEAVRALPDVAEALGSGMAEVSAFWRDAETGVLCRCRPDWVHAAGDAGVILLDVKTYGDASPEEFARQIARKRYHVQDAFYSDGYGHAAGVDVLAFIFVAVEDKYPFRAEAVMLDDISRERGRDLYQRDLRAFARCIESGDWQKPAGIHTVSLPAWAF